MSYTFATVLEAAGYTPTSPEWRTTSTDPVAPAMFGKDHYSTLLYVETRAVDHRGVLNHDHMRCDVDRHPMLAEATKRAIAFGAPTKKYPTRLRRNGAGEVVELADHDDYDCLDDLVACGWVTVTMPTASTDDDTFRDHRGRVVRGPDGDTLRPSFLTGLGELILGRYATWGLTDEGHRVAAALRRHRADGGSLVSFADTEYGPATH